MSHASSTSVGSMAEHRTWSWSFCEAPTWETCCRREVDCQSTKAVDYVLQACEAIAEAHALGMVHRDLKPSNLFLTRRADGSPLVKVLDFGISKTTDSRFVGHGIGRHDEDDRDPGSPLYMSPEQMRSSKNVDARTDVWVACIILHELLNGTSGLRSGHDFGPHGDDRR